MSVRIQSTTTVLALLIGIVSPSPCPGASGTPERGRYLHLESVRFDPLDATTAPASSGVPGIEGASGPFLAQHQGPITRGWRNSVRALGGEILGYVPDNAYIIDARSDQARRIARLPGTRWAGPIPRQLRVDSALRSRTVFRDQDGNPPRLALVIATHRGRSVERLSNLLSSAVFAGRIRHMSDTPSGRGYGYIEIREDQLENVLALLEAEPFVERIWMDRGARPANDAAICIGQSGVGAACDPSQQSHVPVWYQGILGHGQVFGTVDTGLDTDACQFRYGPGDQTLAVDVQPPQATTPDLTAKVVAYYAIDGGGVYDHPEFLFHGSHTAGCAAGDNYATPARPLPAVDPGHDPGDGMAPGAQIVVQDVSRPDNILGGLAAGLTNLLQQAYDTTVRVHNNSYGSAYRGSPVFLDEDFGYDVFSAQVDEAAWRLRDMAVFFSAGNWGEIDTDSDMQPDGIGTIAGLGAVAKNAITVGATGNPLSPLPPDQLDLFAHSSHGPTREGLLKPDVVAPGDNLTAAGNAQSEPPDDTCLTDRIDLATYSFGTSLASATASGYGILVRQYFTDGYYQPAFNSDMGVLTPSNALIKAVLINSGRDLYNEAIPGSGENSGDATGGAAAHIPSNGQGWGRITLDDALYFSGDARRLYVVTDTLNGEVALDRKRGEQYKAAIEHEETHNFGFRLTTVAQDLRITLAWSDPEAEPGVSVPLVNDLDLILIAPGGDVYLGNAFQPGGSYSEANAAAADRINPVECIYLEGGIQAVPGPYSLRVVGTNVPGNGARDVPAQPPSPTPLIRSTLQGYALVITAGDDLEFVTPPSPGAAADPDIVCLNPGTVNFTGSCANCSGNTQYDWVFDPSPPNPMQVQNPVVTFTTPGLYKVRLTVTDQDTGISAVNRLPIKVIVGTQSLPESAGNSLIMNKLDNPLKVAFQWIDVGAPQISSYRIYSYEVKQELPVTPPPESPAGTAIRIAPLDLNAPIRDGEAGVLISETINLTASPDLIFYQVRGVDCDGDQVGPP